MTSGMPVCYRYCSYAVLSCYRRSWRWTETEWQSVSRRACVTSRRAWRSRDITILTPTSTSNVWWREKGATSSAIAKRISELTKIRTRRKVKVVGVRDTIYRRRKSTTGSRFAEPMWRLPVATSRALRPNSRSYSVVSTRHRHAALNTNARSHSCKVTVNTKCIRNWSRRQSARRVSNYYELWLMVYVAEHVVIRLLPNCMATVSFSVEHNTELVGILYI